MPEKKSPLKIIPIGGLGEIGLNCMVFEYNDEIIVVDCGVMFSDLQILGVDIVIPDMTYLKENASKIKAYIITHAHEDHIGALPFALKNHPAPIYCTHFAHKLIESKLEEHGLASSTQFEIFTPGKTISFKNFKVTAASVNHSIIESMALFIDTPVGKIVFTGDFKIDPNPYYGKPMDATPFIEAGNDGVLLLMSDSTNVEREGHSLSEKRIYDKFDEILSNTTGLTVISMFASNIGRIGQILELCKKYNKKLAFLGRSMEQNSAIAHNLGYLKDLSDSLISMDDIPQFDRKNIVVLSTGSQGEYRSGLARIANKEQKNIQLTEGDLVILSSKFIPGNEKAIGRMINNLFKLGADVIYESVSHIHVSGHASASELRAMLNMTKPKYFIPVHGEYRHLVKHRKLAMNTNVAKENTLIAVNGDVIELEKNRIEIVAHMEENRVLIEGEGGSDVSKLVLKDRRKVAETGIVFSVLIRNANSGKILGGPDIMSRGFVEEAIQEELFEGAKQVVLAILRDIEDTNRENSADTQEEIRIGLRRYFNSRIGKKPVVVPILIDV